MAGYHLKDIVKGELGEVSKIEEELSELKDAIDQNSKVMTLVELSDLYGAIKYFLINYFPDHTMKDLAIFSEITERAFKSGSRK